jgi:hypothetical protein
MTEKHISELTREEYAKALRRVCYETAPPPPAPRKPTIVSAMTEDEYRAAKRAINAPVRPNKQQ